MAAVAEERQDSPRINVGRDATVDRLFVIEGSSDEHEAYDALLAAAETLYDLFGNGLIFLPRAEAFVEPDRGGGGDLWFGVARYQVDHSGLPEYAFDTGGGTQHVTQSLATKTYPAGADSHNGAIGVTPDAVEGVDIVVPVYQFTETHYLTDAVVTSAYRTLLKELTGRVNFSAWREYAAGEVLFLGTRGFRGGDGIWRLDYSFAASENREGVTIGPITGIDKRGWEYLWVEYEEREGAKRLVRRPYAVHVEQVYFASNFQLLGIG